MDRIAELQIELHLMGPKMLELMEAQAAGCDVNDELIPMVVRERELRRELLELQLEERRAQAEEERRMREEKADLGSGRP